jgi:hypothetical protein
MKSYLVTAEMVDVTTDVRYLPGDTFIPASEAQRVRLNKAGCLGDDPVDVVDLYANVSLDALTRAQLEGIAFDFTRQKIGEASDEELRRMIDHARQHDAARDDEGEGNGEGEGTDGGDKLTDDLDAQTIEQLKALAGKETIDLTGKTLKPDILAAIREARIAKAQG